MGDAEIKFEKLSNGLQLIGEILPQSQSAAVGFFVKTGSRDESAAESGVSHFLEHMMFKGTARRSALEVNFELGNLGAQANAFTSEENTVYYSALLPENFGAVQELLSDMLRPSLDPQEFDTEKKVILEEIALYQDRPQFYLFEHAHRDYFGEHSAGNSVLGSTETISALTNRMMRDYFERRYAPNNIVLVASGKFEWERFVRDADKFCGGWKPHLAQREHEGFAGRAIQKEYRKKDLAQAHLVLLGPGVSAQSEDRFAISVLAHIIGDSTGSKLYWELIRPGLAESAGADNDERDGLGVFMAYASTEFEKIEEVSAILKRVLNSARDFSDDELERAKVKLACKVVLNGELPMGRLMSIGMEWNFRQAVQPLSEVIARINSVTRAEIESVLAGCDFSKFSEFRLIPQ
ncbi:MAG: peptidase M16 [Proteobacteria bacterium]|nr:MAG: peptidase M16 [Pseudomonadota bacterium]